MPSKLRIIAVALFTTFTVLALTQELSYADYLQEIIQKTQKEINWFNKHYQNKSKIDLFMGKINRTTTGSSISNSTTSTNSNATINTSDVLNYLTQPLPLLTTTQQTNKQTQKLQQTNTQQPTNQLYFTNTTTITGSTDFLQNIDILHSMGYLPFKPIAVDNNTVTWQWDALIVPKELALLTPKSDNNILYRGAVKAFLTQYNISLKNTTLHNALQEVYNNDTAKAQKPFAWVLVDQKQPQKLKIWQNGQWVFEANCNTGVRHLTPDGDFLIYARYKAFTMSGRFPINNQYYYDPDVPYVNFFDGGDAIHGFYRRAYGYPQSAGCVELPVKKSKEAYQLLYTGAVVTIKN